MKTTQKKKVLKELKTVKQKMTIAIKVLKVWMVAITLLMTI